jgi:ribosomal protein S18 acetylase RimI-like enzyme
MCDDKNNKILIFCLDDNDISYNSIVGIIMYRQILNTNMKNRYYIPLLAIRKKARKLGYGKIILNEFMEKIKNNKITEIVLLSLKSSVNFYLKYGFKLETSKYLERNLLNDCIEMKLVI